MHVAIIIMLLCVHATLRDGKPCIHKIINIINFCGSFLE